MAVPIPPNQDPRSPQPNVAYNPSQTPSNMPGTDAATFFLNNYHLGKTLGIGSFGKVKIATHHLTGHQVAVKILNRKKIKQMDMDEKVRREIKILRLFMHPHIIRLYEVIETPNDIYVVMEYVKSGELFDYIVEKGRLMEDEARHFFQQIISGVEYCHRNMVVHRDLKPENLLLDSRANVKIADFGLSNVMRDGHFLKTSCGSPNYAAPEVISGRLYAGPEVDVWSCGVILYALLCGSLPFDDENIPNLFKKIKGGIYTLPSHLSPGARDLIPRMLLVDPLKRITIPEIRQHPWFTVHLPRYLAVMQADPVMSGVRPDDEIVKIVSEQMSCTRDFILDSLRNRQQNQATVAYHLIADNRRRMPSSAYLKEEMTEAVDPMSGNIVGREADRGLGGSRNPNNSRSAASLQPAPRLVVERRWRLGGSSRGHPGSIMQEVYRGLSYFGIGWKKGGPYNVKCRTVVSFRGATGGESHDALSRGNSGIVPGMMDGLGDTMQTDDAMQSSPRDVAGTADGVRQEEIKFEVQLYKVKDGEYALDIQRLEGNLMQFMCIASDILSVLGI